MRKKLNGLMNFNYNPHQQSKSKHIKQKEVKKIKNKIVKNFLFDMVKYGYEKTWEKWIKYLRETNLSLMIFHILQSGLKIQL